MNGQDYLQLLEQRLQRYFDRTPLPASPPLALAAELHAADEGYFLVPSIKTYSVRHDEYLYAQLFSRPLTMEQAQPYLLFLREKMQQLRTTPEHMSSLFVLLLICEQGIEPDSLRQLLQYKYHKDYCFTLKGWSDLAICLADIPGQQLYCNKAGRKAAAAFDLFRAKQPCSPTKSSGENH